MTILYADDRIGMKMIKCGKRREKEERVFNLQNGYKKYMPVKYMHTSKLGTRLQRSLT